MIEHRYNEICNYENLYKAHQRARSGKRFKTEVAEFEINLFSELYSLQEELYKGTYQVSGYKSFIIHDPKERIIHAPEYRDRVVQHCLCDNIIGPVLEKRLIYDNAASRADKGTHFAINRLTGFLRDYYKRYGQQGYILKCDISKYFDSIDHRVLYEKLCRTRAFDNNTLWLIGRILASYEVEHGKGLPLGNQSSQWFALFYLDGLDRLVKERLRIKYYSRYMDDCILIHHDKDYLKHCLEEMRDYVEDELQLNFNRKTQITPIGQGVDYLGFRFYLSDSGKVIRKLRTSNKKRMKRRLKYFKKAYARGDIELDAIKRSIAGYKGHLKHGHTYRLRAYLSKQLVLKKGVRDDEENDRAGEQ